MQELEWNGIHSFQETLAAEHTRRLAAAGHVQVAPALDGWRDLPQAVSLLAHVDQLEQLRVPFCYRADDTVWEVGPDSLQLLEARRLPEGAAAPHLMARAWLDGDKTEEASGGLAEAALACIRAGAPEYALQLTHQALELHPGNAVAAQSLEALVARGVEEPSWARFSRIGSLLDTLALKPIQRTPDARLSPLADEPEGCDYLAWMGRGMKPERVLDYLAATPLLNREGKPNSALRDLLQRSDEEVQQVAHLATNNPTLFFTNFWPALEGRHHLLGAARERAAELVWKEAEERLFHLTLAELERFREGYEGEARFYGFAMDIDTGTADVRLALNTPEQLELAETSSGANRSLRWVPDGWLFPTFESRDFRLAWEPYRTALCHAPTSRKELLKAFRRVLRRVESAFPELPRTPDFQCRVCIFD